jgi:hypothetical protein
MAIPKYICRCGKQTDRLMSHFIDGIRITVCDKCVADLNSKENAIVVNYDKIKESSKGERFYHMIDTREK